MSETQRIADQLKRAYEGKAWHGPAVREVLAGVTASQAAARPLPRAHSIWEIALHIAVWEDLARRRLAGERLVEIPDAEDWPAVRDPSESAWQQTLETLARGNRALRDAILAFPESRLGENPAGKQHSYYIELHGAVQHDLYHAGQIALLKKA
jgi:uncharacterized damage-inducible protein DinB